MIAASQSSAFQAPLLASQSLAPIPAGFLLVDKPTGWTSHDVVNKIRRIFTVKRVGHAGTLDPLATGLLILLIGREYTKMQDQFLKQDKTYLCALQLGMTTDSFDSTGKILEQADWEKVVAVQDKDIVTTMQSFQGEYLQTVPAFSAVKRDGQKLYTLARSGELQHMQLELPQRLVQIQSIANIEIMRNLEKKQMTVSFEVACGSGTYIRSLVQDIGIKIQVGATLIALRRTKIGTYSLSDALPLPMVVGTTPLMQM